uniref:Tubulin polyglutamylase complex subunit 2 n=1 Tax=Sphenodon punctatus TaxID=8508 RepID=A0A8D0HA06_SPHPU
RAEDYSTPGLRETGLTSPRTTRNKTSPGVTEVTFVEKEPAERHTVISWEQVGLGTTISDLSRLGGPSMYTLPNAPTLADLEEDTDEGDQPEKPCFDSRRLIFELDPRNGKGKLCLVCKQTEPVVAPDTEIWFLDRALYWHFLTKTFTAYYRLMITHLGLPQWQYAFTAYGISPQTKQWFNTYKPITISTALLSEEADSFVNKLDPNKVFKSKNKTPVLTQKLASQPAGSRKGQTSIASSGNASRKREPQLLTLGLQAAWLPGPVWSPIRPKPLVLHGETAQCRMKAASQSSRGTEAKSGVRLLTEI